jgi:tetratricopeptide (TPR) repeat protein
MRVPSDEPPAAEAAVDELMRAGDAAQRRQDFPAARQHYDAALETLARLPETDSNRRRRIDLTIKRVSVSIRLDRPEHNLAQLAQAESLLQGLMERDKLRLARIYYWMGRAHTTLNDPRTALSYYRQVLPVAQELGDEELMAIPASTLGQLLVRQGHLGHGEIWLTRASPILEKAEKWSDWVTAHAHLGVAWAGQGRYAAGLAEVGRALERAREWNHLYGIAQCQLAFAGIYGLSGEAPRALEASRTALEVARRSDDPMLHCFAYAYRARSEGALGQTKSAMSSLMSAQAALERAEGHVFGVELLMAYRGQVMLNAGRREEAQPIAEHAVVVSRSTGNITAEGLARRVWGEAARAADEADAQLAESVAVLESGACHVEAAHTHLAWARRCHQRGEVTQARDHAQRAAAQFESSKLMGVLAQAQALI